MIVGLVFAVLAAVVTACLTSTVAAPASLDIRGDARAGGILLAAGLLFFTFAGNARIATQGEKSGTRPGPFRAIPITPVVYAAVAVAVLLVFGPVPLSAATDPLAQAVSGTGAACAGPSGPGRDRHAKSGQPPANLRPEEFRAPHGDHETCDGAAEDGPGKPVSPRLGNQWWECRTLGSPRRAGPIGAGRYQTRGREDRIAGR